MPTPCSTVGYKWKKNRKNTIYYSRLIQSTQRKEAIGNVFIAKAPIVLNVKEISLNIKSTK